MTAAVASLWAAAWERLRAECPDVEARLAAMPPAVSRLESSAARWASRVTRGEVDLIEAEAKIEAWADAVIAALAAQDHARSLRTCLDCGTGDVPTVAPGLTSGRVCRRCLREAVPATATGAAS